MYAVIMYSNKQDIGNQKHTWITGIGYLMQIAYLMSSSSNVFNNVYKFASSSKKSFPGNSKQKVNLECVKQIKI